MQTVNELIQLLHCLRWIVNRDKPSINCVAQLHQRIDRASEASLQLANRATHAGGVLRELARYCGKPGVLRGPIAIHNQVSSAREPSNARSNSSGTVR